ncbi:caspase family protein [Azospirillum sp. TSO35-2]|uniref:caspase family protein n=1 Tax=Azospirillum sp. TSO35-2 TaxID=716796 RepID=UPI000D645612|nr:caspase family protein [Azospirillum sp. TSO35-2]
MPGFRSTSLLASAALVLLTASSALAQTGPLVGAGGPGTKSLVPMPYNANPDVALDIDVSRRQPRIGEMVELCFSASRNGYVTLWDVGTSGRAARIFPNQHGGGGAAATQVTGGQRYCAGTDGDPFAFEVSGPTGRDELYIVWTATAELQPQRADFATAAELSAAFEELKGKAPDSWATFKTAFEIVGPGGPVAPPMPPPQNGGATPPAPIPAPIPDAAPIPGPAPAPAPPTSQTTAAAGAQVYILAMGSNVKPLTKSNQDAAMFVDGFRRLFAVPPSNIRVYNNVYRAQFKEGMEWLRDRAGPKDFVVVYYSGHGAQIPDDDGDEADGLDEAFVTYDVEGKSRPSVGDLVRDDEYAAWVNALRTNQVLNVIDACHSGGLTRGVGDVVMGANPKFYVLPNPGPQATPLAQGNGAVTPVAMRSLTPAATRAKNTPKGTTLAAAREDQSALEGETGSLFTLALLETLGRERRGTMADMFAATSRMVEARTASRQTPVMVGERTVAERIAIQP